MGVLVLFVGLGAHIRGGAYVVSDLRLLFSDKLAKSEICNFRTAAAEEYIGGFEVAVDDVVLLYAFVAFDDVLDESECFELTEGSSALDVLQHIPTFTELSDNVDIVFGHEGVIVMQYILMRKNFESSDFVVE
jgi:hypothetical protein